MRKTVMMFMILGMTLLSSCVVVDSRDAVDLLVFSGQSNMQGKSRDGYPTSGYQAENKETYEYKVLTNTYVPCVHPVGETIPGTGLEWAEDQTSSSLAPFFATHWLALGSTPLVVHVAGGGQSINTFIEDGQNRDAVNNKIGKAIEHIDQIGKTINKRLFFWLQGESDANMTVSEYKTAFLKMWHEKKDMFDLETAYIIRIRAHSKPSYFSILAAQEELAMEHDDIVMLTRMTQDFTTTNGMLVPGDSIHYTTLAYMHMAAVTAQRAYGHSYEGSSFDLEEEAYPEVRDLITIPIDLEGISLLETRMNLPINQTIQLVVRFEPDNASDQRVSWSSSDTLVASVNAFGLVTPHIDAMIGEHVIITVTYDLNPLMTDQVIITITEAVLLSPPYQEVSYYLEQMPMDSGYDVDWMLRSGAGSDTNLYALALIADKVAFNTYIPSTLIRTTWETSPGESIIIPVSPGMRISANSFGLAGLNGGTSNGIRISYMSTPDASGETMISQLTPLETFLEFSTSTPDSISGLPYLTVPMTCGTHQWPTRYMEVVFWTGDGGQNRWVFNLDLNGWRMV